MENPFLSYLKEEKIEYLTPVCSLNKAILAKLPIYGIEDSIQGKSFRDIFSTAVIVDEIKSEAQSYHIDISKFEDYMLPKLLDEAIVSEDVKYRQLATKIATKFGNRLGLLLLALKMGEQPNRDARADWDERHWEYWAQLDSVIFVGGLASGMLGRKIKERIAYIFDLKGVRPYNIMLFDNGTYVGVLGCAQKLMHPNTTALVFDFGHTNLKRCVVRKGKNADEVRELIPLDSVKSCFVHSKLEDHENPWQTALMLHRYLVKVIVDTYKEQSKKHPLCDEIIISIANYNAGGVLNSVRGGYAKLTELSNDYAKLLSEDLSGMFKKRVRVRLVHDGTANALYFSEVENSACISLGTAFGVGFTDIKI